MSCKDTCHCTITKRWTWKISDSKESTWIWDISSLYKSCRVKISISKNWTLSSLKIMKKLKSWKESLETFSMCWRKRSICLRSRKAHLKCICKSRGENWWRRKCLSTLCCWRIWKGCWRGLLRSMMICWKNTIKKLSNTRLISNSWTTQST